jgi:hypothetical protein
MSAPFAFLQLGGLCRDWYETARPTLLITGATSNLSATHAEPRTAGASVAYHDYATVHLAWNRFPLFVSCPGSTEHTVDEQASESGADG